MYTLFAIESEASKGTTVYSLYVENNVLGKSRKVKVQLDTNGKTKFSVSVLSLTQTRRQLRELANLLTNEIDKYNSNQLEDMFTQIDTLPLLKIV